MDHGCCPPAFPPDLGRLDAGEGDLILRLHSSGFSLGFPVVSRVDIAVGGQ